jgi:hypothetical protein
LIQVCFHLSSEVPLGEEAIRWNPMVVLGWFIVPQMLEACSVRMRKVEWHVRETVINSIAFFAFHELLHVVLHNWALSVCCVLSSSCFSLDAVTESKNVFESLVLKSVWVDIYETRVISNT